MKVFCFLFVILVAGTTATKTLFPSAVPSSAPTGIPTSQPSAPTEKPTGEPTTIPTALPTGAPVVFEAETYRGGAGNQNFTWYQPLDVQTYLAYSTHWIESHESWLHDQYDVSCKTQNTLPVCVGGYLLHDPTITCPMNGCMGTSYAVDPCQPTPIDTIDYVPPPITSAGVSAENVCLPTMDESHLVPPYYGLDSGLPHLYSPLKSINLKITGNVYGRTGDLCKNMSELKIDFWHVKTDLLSHAYNEYYVLPEETPLGRGESPPDELSPSALRDLSCRGEVTTSKDGKYTIHTTLPHSYGPPRHINIRITAPNYEPLITRMYFDKDLRLQQLVYDGTPESVEENHDMREEILQEGLQNSFRLKESLHFGPNQVEFHEGYLRFGKEMTKHLKKDPRVAKIEFVPTETIYLEGESEPRFKGIFEAKFDMILQPLRPLEDTKTSPVNAYNITGLWRDDETGGLVKVESDGHLFIAVEFPHIRKWGTVFGNLRGDTISGVDFRSFGRQQRSADERYTEEHLELLRKWTQSDHIWQNDYTMGRIMPTDAFHTSKDEGTIFWSNSKQDGAGLSNEWHKVAHQQVYRFLKLEVTRVGGEQSSKGLNSATSGSFGGGGGRLVINEIEFYQGFLAQTEIPLKRYKMKSPRTPSPQKVTCSSFEDNIRHCFKAFDGDFSANGSWVTDSIGLRQHRTPEHHWILLDLGPKIGDRVFPTSLRIVCGNTVGNNGASSPEGCPMTFTLYGSNNPLKEFDIITHVDMYDYPEMNEYENEGGMVFNFFDEAPFGRLNGQKCGSCDSPPYFSCGIKGYDLTCRSKYCNEKGVCGDSPPCPKGFYQHIQYNDLGAPNLICKNCPAGKYGAEVGLLNPECSGDCDEGCYCTEGATDSCQNSCLRVGTFCPKGSGSPVVAGMGEKTIDAANETNVDTSTWDEDTSQFLRTSMETTPRVASLPCSPGHYCSGGFEIPCPKGQFGNASLLASPSCSGKCLPGDYCPSGSVLPTICPLGHYCPDGISALLCPDGRYGSEEGLKDRSCSGVCPAGYFCPEGSTTATGNICPAGSYGSDVGLFKVSCSGLCKPGYYCPAGSTTEVARECGSISVYCPLGSTAPVPVTSGFYTVGSDDNSTNTAERECEPGYYCVEGQRYPCPPGSFGETFGLASLVGPIFNNVNAFFCSGLCDPGHYCPFNSTSRKQEKCPAGRYGASEGLTNSNCTAICPLGHYCPAGSVLPVKCPAGVFGGYEGLRDSHCHPNCTDEFCSNQNALESLCKEGYYCEEGSITMTHKECGGIDVYCPRGSVTPTPVDEGYYTVGPTPTTRTHQLICEAGYFCTGGVKVMCPPGVYGESLGLSTQECTAPCPAGHYCPMNSHNGTHHRCPAGRYGSVTGLYDRVCENNCAAGYYCPEGSTSPFQKECGEYILELEPTLSVDKFRLRTLSNAYFCPEGSPLPLPAPPGYFTVNGTSSTRSAIEECVPGTYCIEGIIRDCPAGRYGDSYKIFSPDCTGPCRKGYYCPVGSTSSIEIPCPQGTYGDKEGLTTAECSGNCQNPHACLPGSVKDMSKVYSV